jgi:hypothetical protein
VLLVYQVDYEAPEECGVLYLKTGTLEDLAKKASLLAQLLQDMAVMELEVLAVTLKETLPAELWGNKRRTVVWGPRALVGHLEEEQEGDLLGVGHERKSRVPEDVGVTPSLVDYPLGVVLAHQNASSRFVASIRRS